MNLNTELRAALFGEGNWMSAPDFTSDIAWAMQVAEKMVERGHVFIIKGDGLRQGDHSPRWTVLCDNMPRVDGDDLPLTICKAAIAGLTV